MNISDILVQQAEKVGDRPCIYQDNVSWTYRELDCEVWRIAALLKEEGIKSGRVIAHTFIGEIEHLIAMMATARIGATVFSIPVHTPPERRKNLLDAVGAEFLVTDRSDASGKGLKTIPVSVRRGAEFLKPSGKRIRKANPTAPWIIISGSGSTGKPKFMPVTHNQQWERMQAGLEWLPYSAKDIFASLIRLDFFFSKQRCLEAFTKGAGISLDSPDKLNFHDVSKPGKVNVLYGTVFHVEQILASIPGDAIGYLESLKAFMVSGSSVTQTLRDRIRQKLCSKLYVLYGANETHTVCSTGVDEVYGIQGNVGRPHRGFELQIVDKGDIPLPAGKKGYIRIRTKAAIDGYLHDDEATAKAFREGWFYPGDLGRLTEDGQLIYLGRTDDMMIMNGINIYPAEIEQVLDSHPDVHETAAMPLRHKIHQDVPVCAAVLEKDSEVTEKELLDFARQRLGAHAPFRVVILDTIPRNEQGKPVRADLQRLIAARMERGTALKKTSGETLRQGPNRVIGKQLQKRLSFSFIMPEKPDIAMLNLWLDKVLGNDLKTGGEVNFPGGNDVPADTRLWLWRCVQLGRLLLQSARVPVFDPPGIVSCSRKKSGGMKWEAVVELALIEGFPTGMYEAALRTSFSMAGWAVAHPPEGENLHHFYSRVQQRVITPLAKVLPVGKSTFPVLKEAYEMSIPFRHLGGGIFQLGWGAKARRMDRSTTEHDSVMGAKLSHSKVLTARLLRSAGLPTALHEVVTNYDAALQTARQTGWPAVVKPVDRERGEGVTVNVSDEQVLKNAFEHALKLSRAGQVIVERQVPGVCHRLFVANGKLLYAVKRHPMSVTGDGKKNIEELVSCEYEHQQRKPPWKRTEIQPLDQLALDTIKAAGLSVSSVPEEGMLVPLRPIESTQWGGVDEEVTDRVHPENLRAALDATMLFSLHVAGIDIISTDISRPWYENGAIINEVNYAPLFGGGDISRRHIPTFLWDFMESDGRIPVNVFVGGESAQQASVQRWKEFLSMGRHACLTNEWKTFDPSGKPLPMPFRSLYRRVRALTLSPKVEAIVLVVQTDEFLYSGLPLEFVDSITVCDNRLVSFMEQNKQLSSKRLAGMNYLLAGWKKSI